LSRIENPAGHRRAVCPQWIGTNGTVSKVTSVRITNANVTGHVEFATSTAPGYPSQIWFPYTTRTNLARTGITGFAFIMAAILAGVNC